ncbi:Neuronal acetylcholine receptor subunit alpha-7, partial [Blattella germanica]
SAVDYRLRSCVPVQEWNDYNLRWNESEFGGVKDLRITPNKIWRPDILMYNSADEGFDGTYHTNVVVRHNGSCLYVPPGIFKSTCKIDITWFPFDDQHCDMKFGSWTYDGNQVVPTQQQAVHVVHLSPFVVIKIASTGCREKIDEPRSRSVEKDVKAVSKWSFKFKLKA